MASTNEEDDSRQTTGAGMSLGLVLGVAIGVAMNELAMGIALGIVFGAAMETGWPRKQQS